MKQTISKSPALFLDRDGVINFDRGYVFRYADFEWVEGIIDLIKTANDHNWWVVVVTNQSGIGREYYTDYDVSRLHESMLSHLNEHGAKIDKVFFCPFHDNAVSETLKRKSYNRKPAPGMIYRACADLPIDLECSFLIGDKESDIQAAQAAGVSAYLFEGGDVFAFASGKIG